MLALLWLSASCDGESDSTGGHSNPVTACAPGQQIACACGGSVVGYQVCAADGSGYDACVCTDAGAGGSNDGSASGGSSGAGAAGAAGTTSAGSGGMGGAGSGGAGGTGSTGSGGTDAGGGSTGDSGSGDTGTVDGSVDNQIGVPCGQYFCDGVCCLKAWPHCVGGSVGGVCGGTPQQNIGCDGKEDCGGLYCCSGKGEGPTSCKSDCSTIVLPPNPYDVLCQGDSDCPPDRPACQLDSYHPSLDIGTCHCTPGQKLACGPICPDAGMAYRTCSSSSTYGTCTCS